MYYKIENKECEVYKKLHEMRTNEIQWGKENEKAIEEKTGLKWDLFLGREGQQTFNRVTNYSGFVFLEPEKVDLKIWKKTKEYKGGFIPNKKTKLGREMAQFLSNGLKGHWFNIVFDILGLEHPYGKFSFPYVEICGEIIVIFLSDNNRPEDENIIEITSKEFESLRGN